MKDTVMPWNGYPRSQRLSLFHDLQVKWNKQQETFTGKPKEAHP